MEPTIYKPSIYKGAGIYKAGESESSDITSIDIGGVSYPVTLINGQYWTAKNIKYHTSSFVYPDNNSDNEDLYGLLYSYTTAQNEILPILPSGWRIPTYLDFQGLFNYDNNPLNYLNEDDGGNNSNGMNIRLAGNVTTTSITAINFGAVAFFLTCSYGDVNNLGGAYYFRYYTPKITTSLLEYDNKSTISAVPTDYFVCLSLRVVSDKI